MKKLFFFKSSSSSSSGNNNTTDKQLLHRQKHDQQIQQNLITSNGLINSKSEESLRRSRSLSSSAAFLVDGTSSNDVTRSNNNNHRLQNHSSRCFTPERQYKECGSLSTCSSNVSSQVLDRYIDGEEYLERSNKLNNGSSHSSNKGRKLPPLHQSPSSVSDKRNSKGLRDASARSLARSVIERLSHTHHGKSKALSYESISIQDVCGGYNGDSNSDVVVPQSQDVSSELEMRYKEAEKRVKLLSEELETGRDYEVSSLVGDIRHLEEERVGLAFEVLSLLRSQMVERGSAREEMRRVKTDWDLHIKRVEKEKSELQFEFEKEIDRRSSEWTSKFEKFQVEEKRLRERVRELAEHNVSLQREISTFHEKETERIDMIRHLDETVTELSVTVEETREENLYLMQNLSKLQESYGSANEDLACVRRKFEEKDIECKELYKSVTRLLRTCKEQEKTIEGLSDGFSEEIPSEQMRLAGVEFSLRKELESMKLEADALRRENICLMKGNGEEGDTVMMTSLKLDNEMKMRVCHLEEQGIKMLNESTQLCYKFLKIVRDKKSSMSNGLSEQFLIESEMRVHGIRRGSESLKRSLQTVTSLLLEKSNEMESSSSDKPRSHSVEKSLRAELRAEALLTSLLREKMYSMEEEIEQLQAEVAVGVRGNEVLQCEIRNTLDNLSINTHQFKDFKLQMVKKDENINRLECNLQEATKDLASMKIALPKVMEEREEMLKEVKECREMNKDLESEKEMLKKKIEKLEEDILFKEGQITILKDTLGSKHFDLFSSPEFSYDDFLVK